VFAKAITPEANWHLPGAPFFLAATIVALSLLTALYVTRGEAKA
jgi:hypothetical protein